MSKVVDISNFNTGYQKGVEDAVLELKEMEERIFEHALGLLMIGKWQRWSDQQPIGTVFNFHEREMWEADDQVVNHLLETRELIRRKRISLEAKYG